jgi:hypothetical protein
MIATVQSYVEVDWSTFDPWRIQPLRHHLSDHPLLQFDELVELCRRLDQRGSVRTHSADATAGTPFNDAPSLHPNPKSAAETLAAIREAHAWMSLLNVQIDPTYRKLVGEVLDQLRPNIERVDPGMCYRAGWIFVSSPNTVTPLHIDNEHGILVQIHGHKRVYVWDHRDTVVVSDRARDRFHYHHKRDLIEWREEFRSRARVFDVEPGQGVYMPLTSPHMVENGDEPSVTVSFTYYTDSTKRDTTLHKIRERVRGLGLELPAVGKRPWLDACTYGAASLLRDSRRLVRRLAGGARHPDTLPFARVSAAESA